MRTRGPAIWKAIMPPTRREVVGFSHRQNGCALQRIEQRANPLPLRAADKQNLASFRPAGCPGIRRTAKTLSPIFLPCTMIRASSQTDSRRQCKSRSGRWSSQRYPAAIRRTWQSYRETRPSPDTRRTPRPAACACSSSAAPTSRSRLRMRVISGGFKSATLSFRKYCADRACDR